MLGQAAINLLPTTDIKNPNNVEGYPLRNAVTPVIFRYGTNPFGMAQYNAYTQ
jgi:hypothetical protein